MTAKELLIPRVQVIQDYLHNPYKIGDFVENSYVPGRDAKISWHLTSIKFTDEFGKEVEQANFFDFSRVQALSHLFKELPWYSHRKLEDMPKYVQYKYADREFFAEDSVWEVKEKAEYTEEEKQKLTVGACPYYLFVEGYEFGITYSKFLPATKEQYEQYLESLKA